MTDPAPLFDLTLSDEQSLMRDTVRKFAQSEMRERSRKADEAAAVPDGFYDRSAELGFTMVQIPDAQGGIGAERSPLSNMLIAEDLAHGDMAMTLGAMSSLSFVNTVLDQGTEAQRQALLPPFAEDAFRPATIALMEPRPRFDPAALQTTAVQQGDGFALNGEKSMVALGDTAEDILVIAQLQGSGPRAFVVGKGASGLSARREDYMGLRSVSLCRLSLDNVQVPADAMLGGDERPFDLVRLVDLARIGSAAMAVGVGSAILEYVKEYCNDRVAFGEPITHRQSVAFMIADIAIELDGMRLMTYRAASRAEQGLDFHREAYLAHLQCAEKGMKIGTDGVQLLGGHGFIREHMVELWYRNMRALGILEGAVVL